MQALSNQEPHRPSRTLVQIIKINLKKKTPLLYHIKFGKFFKFWKKGLQQSALLLFKEERLNLSDCELCTSLIILFPYSFTHLHTGLENQQLCNHGSCRNQQPKSHWPGKMGSVSPPKPYLQGIITICLVWQLPEISPIHWACI